ncbi:MAG TPA: nucleotidyl transferase AbiEii/AbiGii toxin family protein [Pseudobdellovibrionaceae bacterium]|nr:nucleotidyl transferase AbiEii/AbiGii toxin family protein [Pseudobdellovibrionaceae bacterium]
MGNFKKNFAKWKTETYEHGPRAMTRFVILQFVVGLQSVAPDRYIFKGGNLLWHYIKTPRSTVDVDFATDVEVEIEQVLKDFSSVRADGCSFSVKTHNDVQSDEKSGLAVQMEFLTEEGSTNPFGIDVVFAVKTHSKRIKLADSQVTAASLENIIVDKVSACQRFAGGNTRMKDFDDLYRIAKANKKIDVNLIQKIASERDIKLSLNPKWINKQMKKFWEDYTQKKVYKDASDLPKELSQLIDTTNEYLSNVTKLAK